MGLTRENREGVGGKWEVTLGMKLLAVSKSKADQYKKILPLPPHEPHRNRRKK